MNVKQIRHLLNSLELWINSLVRKRKRNLILLK